MPQFIHLTDTQLTPRIRKTGILARRIWSHEGKAKALHAMPVLPNHYVSHQWLRELRRRGMRSMSAVQFHVQDDCPVKVGRYNGDHLDCTAAEAVGMFLQHESGMGLQVLFAQSIPPASITRIYTPRQIVGWRYYPESHSDGRKPCGCPYCQRGQIKNRRLREAYETG